MPLIGVVVQTCWLNIAIINIGHGKITEKEYRVFQSLLRIVSVFWLYIYISASVITFYFYLEFDNKIRIRQQSNLQNYLINLKHVWWLY